ncbi:MAG: FAD:protein FMN transferase [Rhodocyclaceae bacterium]|nr:FAD:protein FMN transferase [Rhodocyclaceae bacterium]
MRVWLAALISLFLAACGPRAPLTEESYVFGTRVELLVWGAPEAEARAAMRAVLAEFDRLHRAYHAWQPSELTALNEAIAAGRPHEVSAELAALIVRAQALAKAGEYLFDPGIGRLVALWGFHGDEFKPALPEAAALEKLVAAHPSIADLHVSGNTVTSKNRAVALDFGGYLKGEALDRASAILKQHGIANALINIGGNVMALGRRGERPWRVGIQHPRAALSGGQPLATLDLYDGEAIGTSGDYQRFFELDGKRYCHLIDPRTGAPARGTQALTVLIPAGPQAGLRSDVFSKPLFIAGEDWPRLARALGASHVLRVDAAGGIAVTPELAARLTFTAPADLRIVE